MQKSEIIITIIGSAGLNGVITHILYNSKLKKERKMKSKANIWDKIVEALEEIRELELSSKIQEMYDFESVIQDHKYTDFSVDGKRYPSIMNDADTFFEFFQKIINARSKTEKYLDLEVCAYLYYMQNYAMKLMEYLKKNSLTDQYPLAGCFFFQDILTWQAKLDKIIVKRLNKSSYKLYSEQGKRWKRAKRTTDRVLWKNTLLFKLINDIDEKSVVETKKIFESVIRTQ